MKYKVLVTTSGVGLKLGELTKYTNKSLITLGDKPALSYIVEAYPDSVEIVVTLGHFGKQVKDFLRLVYPNRKFTFVEVDRYEGPGSSLLYSMLMAREALKCPFIFQAGDTVVMDKISEPDCNWSGGFKGVDTANYTSFTVFDGQIQENFDKGMINPDYVHIGLVGINDYEEFWNNAQQLLNLNSEDTGLNDIEVIKVMMNKGAQFHFRVFKDWYDVGNTDGLQKARQIFKASNEILDKKGEGLFMFENKEVVKFFADTTLVKNRVRRATYLYGLVPKITGVRGNFYKYNYVKGDLYSQVATTVNFKKFLKWSKNNLWKERKEVSDLQYKKICHSFYYQKTKDRLKAFYESRHVVDVPNIINGIKVETVEQLLSKVPWELICDTRQTLFHGDFILDNIIKTKDGFKLIDWRQDFGGLLMSGDMYYDLGKLNHNLTINHKIIKQNLFEIKFGKENRVDCEILRKHSHVECKKVFFSFLKKNRLDIKKVKIITALIWLNMAPLHHHPFDLFLYYFGKLNLHKAIYDK